MAFAIYVPTALILAGIALVLAGIVTLDQGLILGGILVFLSAYGAMPVFMGIAERLDPARRASRPREPGPSA